MDLTERQKEALLDLGECAGGYEFISTKVLRQLLALDLVCWQKGDKIDFTPAGEQAYKELTGTAQTVAAESR